MLTSLYPLIKGSNYLIIFCSSSINSTCCYRGRTKKKKNSIVPLFFPSSPMLRHLTYTILGFLTRTMTDLCTGIQSEDVKKYSCSCNCAGSAASVLGQGLSRASRVTQKKRGHSTAMLATEAKILYSEKR